MTLEQNLTAAFQAVGADMKRLNTATAGSALRTRTAENEAAPTATNWSARPVGYSRVIALGAAPAPSDAQPGDLHIIATTVAAAGETTTFGTDQTGWPSPWTAGALPAGGSISVSGGRGILTTAATTGNYSPNDAVSARHNTQPANFTITYTFRHVNDVYTRFVLRSETTNLIPPNGIVIRTHGSALAIEEVTNWSYSTLATTAKTWTTGVDYRVKVSASPTAVQAKAWEASAAEPASWDVTASPTLTIGGYFGFTVSTGATAAAYTASYDDITYVAA